MGVKMFTVCQQCFVGGQYMMVVKDGKFICIECDNVIASKKTILYEQKRIERCLSQKPRKYEIKDYYSL
jgi:hypothetical protein